MRPALGGSVDALMHCGPGTGALELGALGALVPCGIAGVRQNAIRRGRLLSCTRRAADFNWLQFRSAASAAHLELRFGSCIVFPVRQPAHLNRAWLLVPVDDFAILDEDDQADAVRGLNCRLAVVGPLEAERAFDGGLARVTAEDKHAVPSKWRFDRKVERRCPGRDICLKPTLHRASVTARDEQQS
jgi:hypothetical protein